MSAKDDSTKAKLGEFTILEHLGEGGMCHVFRARRKGEAHDCALKLLKEERREDEQVRDLFLMEADIALLLDHPNLIATYDAGEIDGRSYIAMELIEGRTLGQLVQACKSIGIEIPVDLALYVVSEILEGLHALHSAAGKSGRPLGVVHRDVTPHNIFVSFDGRVILGDFGVAHVQAYGDSETDLAMGKIGYLAPEAVLGETVDRRADIFAVGIVLHELLTKRRLFTEGTDEEIMLAIADTRIAKPRSIAPSLARGLESAVMKALSRKPKDRFETAEEMLYALEPFWSRQIGNPYAIQAFLSGIFRDDVRAWKSRRPHASVPRPV